MNISYIMMQFPAQSETFASNDIKTLRNLGINVTVYSLKSRDKDYDMLIKSRSLETIKCVSSDLNKNILGFIYLFKNIFLFNSLLIWLIKNDFDKPKHLIKMFALIPISFYIFEKQKQEKPDIVHLFWGHYPSLVGYLIKKKMPFTKLSMFLGAYDLEYELGISSDLSKTIDYIFTHTKVNLQHMENLGISLSKVHVVYRGTTVKQFLQLIEKIDKKNNIWLSVGRLLPSKGFDKVIDLFSHYKEKNLNTKLIIIGDGAYKANLKEQVKKLKLENSVDFIGHVNHDEVLKQMAKTDIFFLLSSKMGERLPNVIKEAMLAKCICITSKTPGIEELIENKKDGFIFEEKDYKKIISTLNTLDSDQKELIRCNARKKICDSFDVEVSMKKYTNIWKGARNKYG